MPDTAVPGTLRCRHRKVTPPAFWPAAFLEAKGWRLNHHPIPGRLGHRLSAGSTWQQHELTRSGMTSPISHLLDNWITQLELYVTAWRLASCRRQSPTRTPLSQCYWQHLSNIVLGANLQGSNFWNSNEDNVQIFLIIIIGRQYNWVMDIIPTHWTHGVDFF